MREKERHRAKPEDLGLIIEKGTVKMSLNLCKERQQTK